MTGDLADLPSLVAALEYAQPDEVYNLGAISFVALSFKQAELTANITGLGVLRMLEAIRMVGGSENNPIRFYQASSSEMFGKVRETPQTELTPFHPRSPYGCAKVFGHDITVNYRESLRAVRLLRASCSTTRASAAASSSSPARSPTPWPASSSACRTSSCSATSTPKRDWGYAGDYVKAMWLMLQQDEPDDYVVATGETHSVARVRRGGVRRGRHRRLAAVRQPGPAVLPPRRGRPAHRRRRQGPRQARLGARGRLPGPRHSHGRPRPRARDPEGRTALGLGAW